MRDSRSNISSWLPKKPTLIYFAIYLFLLQLLNCNLFSEEQISILVKPISGNVNTSFQEFSPTLSPDAKTLYFYSKRTFKGYTEIFKSSLQKDGDWSSPEEVAELNSAYDDQSPFLSRDGKTMFISSNRDGSTEVRLADGKLGVSRDLYISRKLGNTWSKPEILPANINTDQIEENPHFLGDSLLFTRYPFGKPELGKIFLTMREGNSWSDPILMPEPINGEFATVAAAWNDEGNILFFASNRPGGYGGFDLYMIRYAGGNFSNLENLGDVINTNEDEAYIVYQQVKKTFLFCRRVLNNSFDIFSATMAQKPNKIESMLVEKQKISLDTIYFERASAKLKLESTATLDSIVDYLHENPSNRMKIIGHTDLIGNLADNMILSKDRANSVKEYLIRKGIQEQRLESDGKGPTEPMIDKTDEDSSKKNRRTEFVLIGK